MITITLERQNHMNPDMDILHRMRNELELLIASDFDSRDFDWTELVRAIAPFQFEDGSFNLLDSYRIESDCRVYYCHEATYICTALLMKAFLTDSSILGGREMDILPAAMQMCCARHLSGQGYSGMKGQMKALNYFRKCDVMAFLERYPEMCPEFTAMIQNIEQQYSVRILKENFLGDWNENYEDAIRDIHSYYEGTYVFVYGTLMKGQSNHGAFLRDSSLVGCGRIEHFDMYRLGSFPGIVPGRGVVEGELYRVSDAVLQALDVLEDEGNLYSRVPVYVKLDSAEFPRDAFAYVYKGSLRGRRKIVGRYAEA